jgi:hypothetical protein
MLRLPETLREAYRGVSLASPSLPVPAASRCRG